MPLALLALAGVMRAIDGPSADPALRFAAAVATTSLAWHAVVWDAVRAWAVRTVPLPYFDEEVNTAALRRMQRGGGARWLRALLGLGAAASAAVAVATLAPEGRGELRVEAGGETERWFDDESRAHVDLGGIVRADELVRGDDGTWRAALSVRDARDAPRGSAVLIEGGAAKVGAWEYRFTGLAATAELGAVQLEVTPRGDSEAVVSATVTPRRSARVGDVEIVWLESSLNRLDAFGPAVRVEIRQDDTRSQVWLHAWSPSYQLDSNDGAVGLRWVDAAPTLAARVEVRPASALRAALVPAAAAAALGALVLAALLWRERTWVGGLDGDREVAAVALLPGWRPAVERAGEALLGAEAATWRAATFGETRGRGRSAVRAGGSP